MRREGNLFIMDWLVFEACAVIMTYRQTSYLILRIFESQEQRPGIGPQLHIVLQCCKSDKNTICNKNPPLSGEQTIRLIITAPELTRILCLVSSKWRLDRTTGSIWRKLSASRAKAFSQSRMRCSSSSHFAANCWKSSWRRFKSETSSSHSRFKGLWKPSSIKRQLRLSALPNKSWTCRLTAVKSPTWP